VMQEWCRASAKLAPTSVSDGGSIAHIATPIEPMKPASCVCKSAAQGLRTWITSLVNAH
jgi:hypothetical protein